MSNPLAQFHEARVSIFLKMSVGNYKFMQIADAATCVNQRVNIIGVVVETSVPKRSQGTGNFPLIVSVFAWKNMI